MAKSKTLTAKKIAEALESGALVPVLSGTVKSSTREGGVLIVTELSLDSIDLITPQQAGLTCEDPNKPKPRLGWMAYEGEELVPVEDWKPRRKRWWRFWR